MSSQRSGPAGLSATIGTPLTLSSAAGNYDAFPGLVRCANGDLLAAWRRAGGHAATGSVYARRSTDNGATWASEVLLLAGDYGTATFSRLTDGRIAFAGWAGTPPVAVVRFSADHGATFGSPVTVDHQFTYQSVIEGPVTELPDGVLLAAVWGRDTADAANRCSVKVLRSTDAGETFGNPVTVLHGPTSGRYWNEAGLFVPAVGPVVLVTREETAPIQLWLNLSLDRGLTWTSTYAMHGQPTGKWSGAPKTIYLPSAGNGVAAWIARDVTANDAAVLMVSEGGWHARTVNVDTTGRMMYGQVAPIDATTVGICYAVEKSTTQSDVYFTSATLTIT